MSLEHLAIAHIRDTALDELRIYLQITSETNPLIALDKFREKYPFHGSLDKERQKNNAI